MNLSALKIQQHKIAMDFRRLKFSAIFLTLVAICVSVSLLIYINAARKDVLRAQTAARQAQESSQGLVRHILNDRFVRENGRVIVAIRDYVYRKTVVGSGDFDYRDPVGHFLKLDNGKAEMLCGGMAQTYVWILSQYNIPARTVQLATGKFINGQRKNDTHVSVEVFDASRKKWIISDPTFNASFTCNDQGDLLDFQELYDCNRMGDKVTPVEDGVNYLPGRRVHEYYLPYSDLLFGIKASKIGSLRESLELPHEEWLAKALRLYSGQ